MHMTKRCLIAFLIAGFGGEAFADCVPSPDTPASVIDYFQKFNKPLPEQFCAKEDAVPQASQQPSPELPQAYQHSPEPPALERRGHYADLPPRYVPVPEPMYPPRNFEFPPHHSGFEWFY
jgi:hypothetical protein